MRCQQMLVILFAFLSIDNCLVAGATATRMAHSRTTPAPVDQLVQKYLAPGFKTLSHKFVRALEEAGPGTELSDDDIQIIKDKRARMPAARFVGACVFIIIVFMFIAKYVSEAMFPNQDNSWFKFLCDGIEQNGVVAIFIGMIAGFVFGTIDNLGLFFGMKYLEGLFRNYMWHGDEELMRAGYGNAFSDAIGAFLGTFVGSIIENLTGIKETPIWSGAFGIIFGCFFGVMFPRWALELSELKLAAQDAVEDAEARGVDSKKLAAIIKRFDHLDKTTDVKKKLSVQLSTIENDPILKPFFQELKEGDLNGDGWVDRQEFVVIVSDMARNKAKYGDKFDRLASGMMNA